MNTVGVRKPLSKSFLKETIDEWQDHYETPLTEEDARTITSNLTEFFEILMDWESDLGKGIDEDKEPQDSQTMQNCSKN